MKRSTIGSLLFIGGTLVFLLAPSAESSAQGGDGASPRRTRAAQVAPSSSRAGITPPMTTAREDRRRRERRPQGRVRPRPRQRRRQRQLRREPGRGRRRLLPGPRAEVHPLDGPRDDDPASLLRVRAHRQVPGQDDQEALLHRQVRVPEQGRREAGRHEDLVRGRRRVQGAGQAPLRRQRVDARVRRPGAPPVPVRLRAQLAGVQHRQAASGRQRGRDGEPAHARRRGRAPLAGREQRHARVVRQPVRRDGHDRQRRRVGRQRERHALQERPQGRLLGSGPRSLPSDDDGALRELRLLPDRLPLLRRHRPAPRAPRRRPARPASRAPGKVPSTNPAPVAASRGS